METELEKANLSGRWRLLGAEGGRFIRSCRQAGLDLLFPPACAGCSGELVAQSDAPFCSACIGQNYLLDGPSCLRCSAPVPGKVDRERCRLCHTTKLAFDESIALGEYIGLLRDWLLAMKDGRGESLALAIAELIWQRQADRLNLVRADVVLPVPMHWRRRLVRGTNSAAILAERLSQHLRVPLATDLLRRTRHTPPQFSLPPSERPANVRNAFAVRTGYYLNEARVLLVDDILTTGSTCSAAARALKRSGAEHVAVVVAARTLRH